MKKVQVHTLERNIYGGIDVRTDAARDCFGVVENVVRCALGDVDTEYLLQSQDHEVAFEILAFEYEALLERQMPVTAARLIAVHGNWGDHPVWTSEDWIQECSDGNTRRGYWEWVENNLATEEDLCES